MFRGSSQFDKLLGKATSDLLLEPDWELNLKICDCIRQGDVLPKYAVSGIKKKFYAANPNVVLFALQVLEACVKNCGSAIHQEIATKQFMEDLKELVKSTTNEKVKNKILELIQAWAHAFRNDSIYRPVQDTLNVMKVEGYVFPVLKESDAMFVADQAPEWADGDCCHRCRVQFTLVLRKHHCRNCGQVFCAKCTAKTTIIPRLGMEKEVRVCDTCYELLNKPTTSKAADSELPAEYLASPLSQQPQVPPKKTEQEIREEEELELALALSQSEAESKGKDFKPSVVAAPPAPILPENNNADLDPELARYLNRSYWEQKQQDDSKTMATTVPTAPVSSTTSTNPSYTAIKVSEHYQNGISDELDEFVSTLHGHLEIFVNRMKSNSSRGRSISTDTAVQSLFMNLTAMHTQLLRFMQEQEDERVYYEGLQDKLSQIKDARAALDALREDHREKLRREAEEAERVRQIQMAHKLEIMRKKKQDYFEYQRQVALQRMQEQEREMHLRQEQQKQQYMRGIPPTGMYVQQPQFAPPQPPNFAPSVSKDGSPGHSAYPNPGQPHPGQPVYRHNNFAPFNMQAINTALPGPSYGPNQMVNPNLTAQPQGPPPNMPLGGSMAPIPNMIPPNPTMQAMPGGPLPTMPGNAPPPSGPAPEQPPGQQTPSNQQSINEGELISFD